MRKLILLMLMFFPASVFAGNYIVAGAGGVKESIEGPSFGSNASTSGLASEIGVGHNYNNNLAVEADYMNYDSMNAFAGGSSSGYSVGIFALPSTSICSNCYGNNWSIFGRLGIADTYSQFSPSTGYVLSVKSSQSKIAPAFGFGLQVTSIDIKPMIFRFWFDRRTSGDSVLSETFTSILLSAGVTF